MSGVTLYTRDVQCVCVVLMLVATFIIKPATRARRSLIEIKIICAPSWKRYKYEQDVTFILRKFLRGSLQSDFSLKRYNERNSLKKKV